MWGAKRRPVSVDPANTKLQDGWLAALINSMTDGVLALDQEGQIILSNSAALSLLDKNTLDGQQVSDVLSLVNGKGDPINLAEVLLHSLREMTNRSWRLKYSDGSLINLYFSISPVHIGFGSQGQSGFVILMRDITREKTLEEERQDFISVATHELRTPVAIAEGSLSNTLLLAGRNSLSEPLRQSLSTAHDQILFLSSLINDLSTLSRAERGKLTLSVQAFDAAALVNELVHDYQAQTAKKGLTLLSQVEPGVGSLTSSYLYVREILQNFITNSLKYTEKGQVAVGVMKRDNGVEFSVADTGIGIGKSEHPKLFDKFFRSQDWRVQRVTGTGLGLYIAIKLAKLINATITSQSQLNHGSVFKLYVPNLPPPPAATKTPLV